jgi:GTP:adenosylcobinamide-phosphate guanylyltransferase
MTTFDALVLAGSRSAEDPLAEIRGDTHRSLLPVAGVPMLLRVVRALRAASSVERIAVSIDEPHALDRVPELRELAARGAIAVERSLSSPSRSVLHTLGSRAPGARVLVTTADHALLTPEIVDHFARSADATAADLAVGVVDESVIRASHPTTTRTYLRFRDGGYSGANLFAFRAPAARHAAEFWVRAEVFRKQPWRLARAFGATTLLLFALRRLRFDEALARASRAIGCSIRAVALPFAQAAIDVDRPSDLELASEILEARERAQV